MDTKLLNEIIAMVEKAQITSFEVSEGDFRIKIEKQKKLSETTEEISNNKIILNAGEDFEPKADVMTSKDSDLLEINSPMLGVFYSSPSPDSEPFVKVGDTVKKGDVVCIIEAMKLMNEICAEEDGVIKEICSENSQIVEFGQALYKYKK